MAIHQLAKGLASLGRHGDSMLMHVSPSEVAGLQQLGKMTGHKLHTNPHTGMPEAFDFGDFITNMLPTIAAIALSGPTGGTSLAALPETMAANVATTAGTTAAANAASSIAMAPILGGMATGAAVAGAKGEDPLMGGLMGGVSGYGAQGLTSAFNNMAAINPTTAADIGTTALKDSAGNVVEQIKSAGIDSIPNGSSTELFSAPGVVGDVARTGIPDQTLAANSGVSNLLGNAGKNLGNVTSGLGDLVTNPIDTYKKFTSPAVGGSGMQLATTFGLPALQAAIPGGQPIDMTAEEAKRKAEANKYVDKLTGRLNLSQSRPDFGTALMATGGTVGSNQSTIASGGLQDLYGSNDNTTGAALSKDGYGIGRLANLAAQGSIAKAQDTFYAMGGPVSFAEGGQNYLDGQGDGMSDSIPATIEGKQPARLADGEFVIPADVVSHIGNGSSKAGSKQLYTMLDRIRKARTGHTKQGKEIKPHKYLPA
jgi:hypothetical protein